MPTSTCRVICQLSHLSAKTMSSTSFIRKSRVCIKFIPALHSIPAPLKPEVQNEKWFLCHSFFVFFVSVSDNQTIIGRRAAELMGRKSRFKDDAEGRQGEKKVNGNQWWGIMKLNVESINVNIEMRKSCIHLRQLARSRTKGGFQNRVEGKTGLVAHKTFVTKVLRTKSKSP